MVEAAGGERERDTTLNCLHRMRRKQGVDDVSHGRHIDGEEVRNRCFSEGSRVSEGRDTQQRLTESITVQHPPVAKQPLDVDQCFMEEWNSGDDEAVIRYSQWVNCDVHTSHVMSTSNQPPSRWVDSKTHCFRVDSKTHCLRPNCYVMLYGYL